MPCEDITELLKLTLDSSDRVIGYSLSKITCGSAIVGSSLIREIVKFKHVNDVSKLSGEEMLQEQALSDTTKEYLFLKHLFAVQSLISVIDGRQTATPDAPCVINSVISGPDGTEYSADIKIEMLTDKIAACANCCRAGS